MDIILTAVFGVLGTAVGSFLNVSIDRLPKGESLMTPSSYCDACRRRLSPTDLVPVFSFLLLRRRCRACQALIPWRVFWVEVATGLLFAFIYWYHMVQRVPPQPVQLAVIAFYSSLFIVLLGIDLEHRLILNKVVFPAAAIAVLLNLFAPQPQVVAWLPEVFRNLPDMAGQTVGGLAGGATGFVLLLVPAIAFRGGIGWGDVKMAGLIGLVVGFPMIFVAILGAMVAGGLVGALLLAFRLKGRKDPIPYAPFLSLATMATILFGDDMLRWYLGLFQ